MEPSKSDFLPFSRPPLGQEQREYNSENINSAEAETKMAYGVSVQPVAATEVRYLSPSPDPASGRQINKVSACNPASLIKLSHLVKMSEPELLHVVFDHSTLLDWDGYHKGDEKKASNLVNAWVIMLDAILEDCLFYSEQGLKSLMSNLHAVYLANAFQYSSKYKNGLISPGQYRFESLEETPSAPEIRKRANLPSSPEGLSFHETNMRENSALGNLPELPPFCLRHTAKHHKMLKLAIPFEVAMTLEKQSVFTEEEVKKMLADSCQYYLGIQDFEEYLQKLKEISEDQYLMVARWKIVYEYKLLTVETLYNDDVGRLQMAVRDFIKNMSELKYNYLRYNKIPQSSIEVMLDYWFKTTIDNIRQDTDENGFDQVVSLAALKLIDLRPFHDGNTRIACLLIQVFRLAYGYSPLMFENRYVFNAGKEYLYQEVLKARKYELIRGFNPTDEQLRVISPLFEKLRNLFSQ